MKTRGYSKAPYKLGSFYRDYFKDLEQKLGKEITVVWGGCQSKYRDRDDEGIILFDYGTPAAQAEGGLTVRINQDHRVPDTTILLDTGGLQKLKRSKRYETLTETSPEGTLFHVANYEKDTVWLLIPLATYSTRDALDAHVKKVLESCVDYKALGVKQAAKSRAVNDGLRRIIKTRITRELEDAKLTVTTSEERLRRIEREAATAEQGRLEAQQRIEELKARSELSDEQLNQQTKLLKDHKYLDYIQMERADSYTMDMYLHPLYLHSADHKERTYLGRIKLRLNLRENIIAVHNLDNARNGHSHPHCNGTNPCWGNMSASIGRMMGAHNLAAILDTLVSYLENYNITDQQAVVYAREWWSNQEIEYLNPHTKKYESLEEKNAREKKEREEAKKHQEKERIDPLADSPARQPQRGERIVLNG